MEDHAIYLNNLQERNQRFRRKMFFVDSKRKTETEHLSIQKEDFRILIAEKYKEQTSKPI